MSETIRTNFLHRLWNTPLRDAFRLRASGRLDWRGRLATAVLPAKARELIRRIVRHTRLWRIEKAAVADELIAHFTDAIQAARPLDAILADFGDGRRAARLIRRAKKRNRPVAWHVWRWRRIALLVWLAIYGRSLWEFYFAHPHGSVDYLAMVNRPIEDLPESDRAWPLYRQAIISMLTGPAPQTGAARARVRLPWLDCNVDGKRWPAMEAFVQAHSADIALLRRAAAKPELGYVYGPAGSMDDPLLGGESSNRYELQAWKQFPSLSAVLVPYDSYPFTLTRILQADAKLASLQHDSSRAVSDVDAILGLADQIRRSAGFAVDDDVAINSNLVALDVIERALTVDSSALSDRQLSDLAQRIAEPKTDADLISLRGWRLMFEDTVQNAYTPQTLGGAFGGGRLTLAGLHFLDQVDAMAVASGDHIDFSVTRREGPAIAMASASRGEVLSAFDRLLNLDQANLARPLREADWSASRNLRRKMQADTAWTKLRFGPIAPLLPDASESAAQAERYLGRRDGVLAAIALERYRRQFGRYPAELADLVPTYLAAVPADRITGAPIQYRLIGGAPLLYSVGGDRIDDGGRRAPDRFTGQRGAAAAQWWPQPNRPIPQGDWILYPVPVPRDWDEHP